MSFTCTKEFQITVNADPFDTAVVLTAVKKAAPSNETAVLGDARCVTGTGFVTGVVFYMEGAVILGNANCSTYGLANGVNLGVLAASKIVHGDLTGTGGYHNSSSANFEAFGAGYWPNTVQIDAASLAAFQALDPGVFGTMTLNFFGAGIYNYLEASFSMELFSGSTLVFQWPGGLAVYKRHDNSQVPTGVFYFYVGTLNPIAQVTIS